MVLEKVDGLPLFLFLNPVFYFSSFSNFIASIFSGGVLEMGEEGWVLYPVSVDLPRGNLESGM